MQDPILSIVTPSYNSQRFIKDCIESVQHACQNIPFEHIIMDGDSQDDTLKILKNYPHLRVFSEKDTGMYDALNKGISLAKGKIIGHLNSDEQYNQKGLCLSIQKMIDDPSLDGFMSPTVMLDQDYKFYYFLKQIILPQYRDTLWFMPIQSCSFIYRKELWDRIRYDVQYRLVADHIWFRQQMQRGLNLSVAKEPIGIFIWHGNNLSCTEGKSSVENATADINKKSLYIYLIKHYYRFKKLIAGGYRKSPISYQFFQNGVLNTVYIKKPKLRP